MYLIHACVMIASKRQEFDQGLGLSTKHGHLGSLCTFGSAGELVSLHTLYNHVHPQMRREWGMYYVFSQNFEEKEVILRCGKHLLSWYVK